MNTTLWSLQAGDRCQIESFDPSLTESYRTRLMELGFQPGEVLSCLQSPAMGAPKVYRINNSSFSLDNQVACAIYVRPIVANE